MTIETKFNPGDTAFALLSENGRIILRKIEIKRVSVENIGILYCDADYHSHLEFNLFHTAKGAADALLQEFTSHESKLDL